MSSDWLSGIRDDTYVTKLTIPGTHDSASWLPPSTWSPLTWSTGTSFTWAQRKNFTEQLDLGVRVLDLRIGLYYSSSSFNPEDIWMVHGPREVNDQSLKDVLEEVHSWLDSNPSEFVVLMFQQQGTSGVDFRTGVQSLVRSVFVTESDPARFFPFSTRLTKWPTVGDLRGKVLVMERLKSRAPEFFDVHLWPDNPLGADSKDTFVVGHKGKLRIHLQDRYKGVSSTGGHWVTPSKQKECQLKVKIVMDADRAGRKLANNRAVWQINHASFSNKRYEPYTTGEIVNRLLRAKRFASPGIVMLDDVDSAICDHVIGHNSAYVS